MPGKLHILYGEDDLSVREAFLGIKKALAPEDSVFGGGDAGTTTLDGKSLSFGQLEMACNTVPFLAEHRLVVVEGLLERFQQSQNTRPVRAPVRRQGASATASKPEGEDPWARLPAMVKAMPLTTVLVLLSGKLDSRNAMLASLRELGEARAFPALAGMELQKWIRDRVERNHAEITSRAVLFLEMYSPGDMRRLGSDIEKLLTYAGKTPIDEQMVEHLVEDAREASVFTLVDAVIEGRHAASLRLLRQMLDQGAAGPYVITMLARQVRMLLIARSLSASGGDLSDLPRLLGTNSDFVARKVAAQARYLPMEKLARMHRLLLEADVAMKDGTATEELALETLLVEAILTLTTTGTARS